MDKIWHRGVIRYLQKKGLTTKEIHSDMASTLGDDAPVLSTVKKWAAEFKRGRESLEDDPRSGRPSIATTQEKIDRIHQMVMNDRRLTISHLANVISISRERVENILHNKLGVAKVLLHQGNAPAHKSLVAMFAVHDCGFELIDHSPYSPNLAPSDYFLFPNLKKHLAGKRYESSDDVISAVEDFFEGQKENFLKCKITYPA